MSIWYRNANYFATLVAFLTGCTCSTPEQALPLAQLRVVAGHVQVEGNAPEPASAQVNHVLVAGDVVSTGDNSRAVVHFQTGQEIELGANAALLIRPGGGQVTEVGTILLKGSAKAQSQGGATTLTIGTPFGITVLGAKPTEIELSVQGLSVIVGEASVELQGGQKKAVEAGHSLQVDGLVITGRLTLDGLRVEIPPPPKPMLAEPLTIVLASTHRGLRIKHGDGPWQAADEHARLQAGDSVKTGKTANTKIAVGKNATLVLGRDSEVTFVESSGVDGEHSLTALRGGSATYQVAAGQASLEIGNGSVEVAAGPNGAEVHITRSANGAAVVVDRGSARLGSQTIEAGQRAEVQQGKLVAPPASTTAADISIESGRTAVVNVASKAPAVAFTWERGKRAVFQIDRDGTFQKPVVSEVLTTGRYVYSGLRTGTYHWRVIQDGTARTAQVHVERDTRRDGAIPRANVVSDTGETTVIYYQRALPEVTLQWQPVERAQRFRLKVYRDPDFDHAVVDRLTETTTERMPSASLREGKYYWYVEPLDSKDQPLRAARMNTLTVAFDNAVKGLRILTPADGAIVSTTAVETRGEVERGLTLMIGDKRIATDGDGRFHTTLPLQPGRNVIVYRILGKGRFDQFYARTVTMQ